MMGLISSGKLRRRPSASRTRYNNFPSPYSQQQNTAQNVNPMSGSTLCAMPTPFADYSLPNQNFFGRLPANFLNLLHQQQQMSAHSDHLQQQKLMNPNPGLMPPMTATHLFMPGPSSPPNNTPPTSTTSNLFGPETFLNLQSFAAAHPTNPLFLLQDLQKFASLLNGPFAKKN